MQWKKPDLLCIVDVDTVFATFDEALDADDVCS